MTTTDRHTHSGPCDTLKIHGLNLKVAQATHVCLLSLYQYHHGLRVALTLLSETERSVFNSFKYVLLKPAW